MVGAVGVVQPAELCNVWATRASGGKSADAEDDEPICAKFLSPLFLVFLLETIIPFSSEPLHLAVISTSRARVAEQNGTLGHTN